MEVRRRERRRAPRAAGFDELAEGRRLRRELAEVEHGIDVLDEVAERALGKAPAAPKVVRDVGDDARREDEAVRVALRQLGQLEGECLLVRIPDLSNGGAVG